MLRVRVIPTLLLRDRGLVKGVKFRRHRYIGDPINAVKIFNEKEVDELVFLDIGASEGKRGPDFDLLADIASEAFMPFAYGGGITEVEEIERLFSLGVEKVIINSAAYYNNQLITDAATIAGSQSIVVSMDVKKSFLGKYEVYVQNGQYNTKCDPVSYATMAEDSGAGELLVCAIDRDGMGNGYDIHLLEVVANAVEIPVIGLGGARTLQDLADAKNRTPISGLAAGDMFVFYGKHKAVLITYPKYSDLEELFL